MLARFVLHSSSPDMKRSSLDKAIEALAQTGDLDSLSDHLADDVELDVAVTVDVPAPVRRFGKRAVLDHFRRAGATPGPAERQREVLADGERVVVLRDERVTARSGLAIGSAYAVVLDVRHGAIARVAIHYELQPAMPTGRASRDRRDLVTAEAGA